MLHLCISQLLSELLTGSQPLGLQPDNLINEEVHIGSMFTLQHLQDDAVASLYQCIRLLRLAVQYTGDCHGFSKLLNMTNLEHGRMQLASLLTMHVIRSCMMHLCSVGERLDMFLNLHVRQPAAQKWCRECPQVVV